MIYGSGVLVLLLVGVAAVAWTSARAVEARAGRPSARIAQAFGITSILAALLFFKYAGFLAFDVGLGAWLGAGPRLVISAVIILLLWAGFFWATAPVGRV